MPCTGLSIDHVFYREIFVSITTVNKISSQEAHCYSMAFNIGHEDMLEIKEEILSVQQKLTETVTIEQSKVNYVQVCRICFVTDCTLNTMKVDKNLRQAYNSLTGLSMDDEDNVPPYLCIECSSQLLRCTHFRNRTLQAHLLLLEILRTHDQITLEMIRTVKNQNDSGLDIDVAQSKDIFGEQCRCIKEENFETNEHKCLSNEPTLLHDVILDDIKKENDDTNTQDSTQHDNVSVPYSLHEDTVLNSFKEENLVECSEEDPNIGDISNDCIQYSDVCVGEDFSSEYLTEQRQTGFTNITKVNVVKFPDIYNQMKDKAYRTQRCGDGLIFYDKLCCDMCPYKTFSDVQMLRHLQTHSSVQLNSNNNKCKSRKEHSLKKVFICHICKKTLSSKCNLQKHIKTHSQVKEYKCEICKKGFVENRDLQNHLRTHSGEKPYSCDLCKKSFSERGNLLRHIRIHAGEKPFSCKVCRRSFNQRHHLKRHMTKHC